MKMCLQYSQIPATSLFTVFIPPTSWMGLCMVIDLYMQIVHDIHGVNIILLRIIQFMDLVHRLDF
jgi:hypothetical protein